MRIALVAPLVSAIREPPLGGSQAFIADLARGLADRGHDVKLYAASGSVAAGVDVVDTGVDARALAATRHRAGGERPERGAAAAARGLEAAQAAFAGVYAAIRSRRYDVVHNHAFDAPAVDLATSLGAAVVHTLHLPPDAVVADAVRRAASDQERATVACVSSSQARAWRALVRVDAVLRPCVPTRAIPFRGDPGRGAVFAGRFSAEKGAAAAIAIAAAAGVTIDVFGERYDPDYAREQIDPHRDDRGVAVHAAVARAELWERLSRAAVLICPPNWAEPFGMVAAESQACGTPVVAFRRGALAEVIADGRTGFLVAPDDILGAAAAVRAAPALSRAACREHAERRLDLASSLDAHERLYRRVAVAAGAHVGA